MTKMDRHSQTQLEPADRYRRLLEQLPIVIWQAQLEGWRFTLVSPHAQTLLGYPLEQWYQEDFWLDHLHPDDRERVLACCYLVAALARIFHEVLGGFI